MLSFRLAVISCDIKSSTSGCISTDNTTTTVRVWILEDGGWFYVVFSRNGGCALLIHPTVLFYNLLEFNSPPLGAKVFDSHSNTPLFAVGQYIFVFGSSLKAAKTLRKQSQIIFYRDRIF